MDLVTQTEMARRLGITRQALRPFEREGFPKPVQDMAFGAKRVRLWDWAEIERWAREHPDVGRRSPR